MSSPRLTRRLVLPRLALVCGGAIVALALLELGLRMFGYGEGPSYAGRVESDGMPTRRGGHDSVNNVDYGMNASGFRGVSARETPFDGLPRIVVYGDSMIFGYGVADDQTMPAQLEAVLKENGRPAHVFNEGVVGANLHQEWLLAMQELRDVRPDLVILALFENDAEVAPANQDPGLSCGLALRPWERLDRLLLRSWYGYRPVHAIFSLDHCSGPSWCGQTIPRFDGDTIGERCFRHALIELVHGMEQAHTPLLVLEYPRLDDQFDPVRGMRGAKYIEELGRQAGIAIEDLTPAFSQLPVKTFELPHDGHPNGRAHRLAAEYVDSLVQKRFGALVPGGTASQTLRQ